MPVCIRDGSSVKRVCRSGQSGSVIEDENVVKLLLRKSLCVNLREWVSNFLTRRVEEISSRLALLGSTVFLSALEQRLNARCVRTFVEVVRFRIFACGNYIVSDVAVAPLVDRMRKWTWTSYSTAV